MYIYIYVHIIQISDIPSEGTGFKEGLPLFAVCACAIDGDRGPIDSFVSLSSQGVPRNVAHHISIAKLVNITTIIFGMSIFPPVN
jgi:hypothetical protein